MVIVGADGNEAGEIEKNKNVGYVSSEQLYRICARIHKVLAEAMCRGMKECNFVMFIVVFCLRVLCKMFFKFKIISVSRATVRLYESGGPIQNIGRKCISSVRELLCSSCSRGGKTRLFKQRGFIVAPGSS